MNKGLREATSGAKTWTTSCRSTVTLGLQGRRADQASSCSATRGPRRSRWARIVKYVAENLDPARHMVGLSTDDVDADWKRLKATGVEFVEGPTDYGTFRIATLKDPEGNLLQLLQPLPS